MLTSASIRPEPIPVKRSDLRSNQRALLKKAKGHKVLLVKAGDEANEKYVLDKKYFDEFIQKFEAVVETLEIVMDRKLFNQILAAADTLEEDLRLGSLAAVDGSYRPLPPLIHSQHERPHP